MKIETKAIHSGIKDKNCVVTPIAQTAGFRFTSTAQAAARFNLEEAGDIYSRMGNPTVNAFESRINALDGGVGALALASGMTAAIYCVMTLCTVGDNIVASPNLYGGVTTLFKNTLKNIGVECRFVEHDDPENFRRAADEKTKAFFGEVLPNPKLNVFPIAEVAKIGDDLHIPLVLDNTCATPVLCRPIEHGAHIVFYSATKYLGGHGNSIGGVVVDSGKFDWCGIDNMDFNDSAYHGKNWAMDFGRAGFITKMRAIALREMGGCMAPMNAFLFSQGLETLPLRMREHCNNAMAVAEYLKQHPNVNSIRYPAFDGGLNKSRAEKYLGGYYGPMVGADIKGGRNSGQALVDNLKLFTYVANIGDVRSMIIHPASTTHSQLTEQELIDGGITEGYVRICVGIEHVDDLIDDLEQGLK